MEFDTAAGTRYYRITHTHTHWQEEEVVQVAIGSAFHSWNEKKHLPPERLENKETKDCTDISMAPLRRKPVFSIETRRIVVSVVVRPYRHCCGSYCFGVPQKVVPRQRVGPALR